MQVEYNSKRHGLVRGAVRPGSFTLGLDDGARVLSCDEEGRPRTLWRRYRTLRRGYSGKVIEVWRDDEGVRHHRDVSDDEWALEWEQVRASLQDDLSDALSECPELVAPVTRATALTLARLEEDAARYRALYGAVGILPPDGYLDIVLQSVVGCPYNRCTFCDFYQDVPLSVRDPKAFAEHCDAVLSYLGRAHAMRRGVFLADADGLATKDEWLLSYLEIIRQRLPKRRVSTFTTPFLHARRSVRFYRQARELGLRRAHLGVESGSPAVLDLLGKPAKLDRVREMVEKLVGADVRVGLILMVGAGGDRFGAEHVADSIALVRALPLGQGDLIYLSPMVVQGRSRYLDRLEEGGSTPLERAALDTQMDELRAALRVRGGPKVARYDIADFLD